MAYNSSYFKCREAYHQCLYYSYQIEAKRHYANSRYWALDRKIEALVEDINGRNFYADQLTRKARYLEQLRMQKRHWDRERSKELGQFLERRYGRELVQMQNPLKASVIFAFFGRNYYYFVTHKMTKAS